jgi:hypothetical protein
MGKATLRTPPFDSCGGISAPDRQADPHHHAILGAPTSGICPKT